MDHGSLLVSYEKHIAPGMSLNQDLGYIFHWHNKPSVINLTVEALSGYEVETELRRYFSPVPNDFSGKYLALGIKYKYIHARDEEAIFQISGDNHVQSGYTNKKYSIYRHELAIHLKAGYQHVNASGFCHDYSFGLGWRRISARNTLGQPFGHTEYEYPYNKPFRWGTKSFLSLTLAIRIGWQLGHL